MHLSRRSLLAGATAAALTACSRQAGAAPLSIGFQKNGLLLIGRSRGSIDAAFKAAGRAAPQWIEFPSGPPMMEAMAAGGVDVGAVGETPPIFAQAAGSPIVYIASQPVSGLGSAIVVAKSSPIASIAGLKGRKVGFTKGSSAHLIVAKALKKAGLTFADIEQIHLSPADAAGAFANGSIDAWSIWDPFLAIAEAQNGARAIVTGAELPPSDGYFVGGAKAVEAKGDQLAILIKALRAEGQWVEQHQDEAVRIVSEQSGLPPAIVATSLRRTRYSAAPLGPDTIARQQANADLFTEFGIIPARIDVSKAMWQGPAI